MEHEIIKYNEQLNIIAEQEGMLIFDSFTNEDALKLGNFIIEEAKSKNFAIAVAVRKINGAILFHHLMTGTTKSNQKWMERKFNTVAHFEHSSLYCFVKEIISGESVKDHGLNDEIYKFCGGGFPIILKTGEFVGVVTVSNLPHFKDHKFLIECLAKYLSVNNVPEVQEI